jgi:hypothetical protein
MARLQDLRPSFTDLKWLDQVVFIEEYRTKRYNDLNTIQEFNLSKQQKTKSTKAREPKEPSVKKVAANKKLSLSPEQLSLLKQLGLV